MTSLYGLVIFPSIGSCVAFHVVHFIDVPDSFREIIRDFPHLRQYTLGYPVYSHIEPQQKHQTTPFSPKSYIVENG